MSKIIRAKERHFSDFGWLKTYWLFSFSGYYDPDNIQFGALRVFNDDIVDPGQGFPTHPHEEMEIITIPLNGQLTHADSMGNQSIINYGDVQRMSAGMGLTHSEFNLDREPVHFYQIWIYPDQKGLEPTYDQRTFDPESWKNMLFPVASGQNIPDVVTFHTNATIYLSQLDRGKHVDFEAAPSRRVFVYVTGGTLEVGQEKIHEKDQLRMDPDGSIQFRAIEDCSFVLIDVPSCRGWGYSEETLKGAKK